MRARGPWGSWWLPGAANTPNLGGPKAKIILQIGGFNQQDRIAPVITEAFQQRFDVVVNIGRLDSKTLGERARAAGALCVVQVTGAPYRLAAGRTSKYEPSGKSSTQTSVTITCDNYDATAKRIGGWTETINYVTQHGIVSNMTETLLLKLPVDLIRTYDSKQMDIRAAVTRLPDGRYNVTVRITNNSPFQLEHVTITDLQRAPLTEELRAQMDQYALLSAAYSANLMASMLNQTDPPEMPPELLPGRFTFMQVVSPGGRTEAQMILDRRPTGNDWFYQIGHTAKP